MVTELCTGSHLHSSTPYPEARARKIVAQILDAVKYMHERGLYHNNLTTENSAYHKMYHSIGNLRVWNLLGYCIERFLCSTFHLSFYSHVPGRQPGRKNQNNL